jgi:16S rRNA (guanine(966)-N(2))-methyltransferase RsmD
MRVIGGRLRGRRLSAPTWPGLRPSSDRLRETLFDVLGAEVVGARVLDLCAGTGAVGLEAISRGAAHATFVDDDARACRLIAENLAACGLREGYAIVRSPLERVEWRPAQEYEVVYLDPPYEHPSLDRLLDLAAKRVSGGGVLVVEHSRRRTLPERAGALVRTRVLRSGDAVLSFFRHAHPAAPGNGAAETGTP